MARHLTLRAPIIDAHVHIWRESDLVMMPWNQPGGPHHHEYGEEEYREAIGPVLPQIAGYIYVETDRTTDPDAGEVEWEKLREEALLFKQLCEFSRPYCAAGVLFAPMLYDNERLQAYVARVEETLGSHIKIAGFRYLLQDKPADTVLHPNLFDNLMWLGSKGYTFDLGITHADLDQIDNVITLVEKLCFVYGKNGQTMPMLVIGIMPDDTDQGVLFDSWERRMHQLSRFARVSVKLSGLFTEMASTLPELDVDADPQLQQKALTDVIERVAPYINVCLHHFGVIRCMFASNYPIENVEGGGNRAAWLGWYTIMKSILASREPWVVHHIWWRNALSIYSISLSDVPGLEEFVSALDSESQNSLSF